MNYNYKDLLDLVIKYQNENKQLQQENEQLKLKWKILKEYINNQYLDSKGIITRIKDKIEVIESGDSDE